MINKPKFVGETLERLKRMAADGASAAEIAIALKTTPNVIYVIARRKRIRLVSRRGRQLAARVAGDVAAAFEVRAKRDGIHAHELLRRIITAVARDDLFDAVLDSHDAADGLDLGRQEQTTNV
jgi:hypothetical protein